MTVKNNKRRILKPILLAVLVICGGVLCGFSLSSTGQQTIGDAYGRIVSLTKQSSVKHVMLNGKDSGKLTYKETMNKNDAPATLRSDSFGTYDVYADEKDNEYIFLINSDTLCGFKAIDPTKIPDHTEKAVTQDDAKATAAAYMDNLFGSNSHEYKFESIEATQMNVFYVNYYFYIDGIKTDDACTLWVHTSTGEVTAWHAFNRGRYNSYANTDLKLSSAKSRSVLQKQLPLIKSDKYKIKDQYITKTDDGTLVMHYEIENKQDEYSHLQPYEVPIQ